MQKILLCSRYHLSLKEGIKDAKDVGHCQRKKIRTFIDVQPTSHNMALKRRVMYCAQLAFVFVNLLHTQAGNIICPDIIKVELGSDVIISCDMNNLQDVYWFRGSTLRTSPILRLEGNDKGGTEYENGQFDIYANGSIRINAVSLEHEGSYNVVAYFTDGSSGESSVNVSITVTPTFPCPVINTCKDCADCNVTVNSSGFIECSINRTRPKMFLSWEIDTQVGFSLFEFKPIVHHETSLDTWSSRIRLKHDGKSCNGKLIIRCVADDPAGLLTFPFSSINIFTVPCSEDLSIERHFPKALLICVVLIVFVLIMGGIGCFAYIFREKRPKRASTSQEDSQEKVPLSTQENTVIEKTTDYLMQGLKEVNKRFCFLSPAPGCKVVSVTAVYTDIQCLVTSKTVESEEVSSDVFLETDFIFQERFVLFQGKLGYGKTVLVLRMLHEVLSNRNYENDSIIIYVPVQNYDYSTTLFDIVKEQLPKENIISEEDFEETLEVSKFLVILDGFYGDFANTLGNHDPTIGTVKPSTTSSSMEPANCKNTCTIAKLLDPAFIDKYKNIKLWVTTRETLPCTIPDHLPFKKVEVKGFSDESRELFISKVYTTRSFPVDKDQETEGMSPTFGDYKQQSEILEASSMGAKVTQGASGDEKLKTSIIQDQDQHRKNCRKLGILVNKATKDFNFISEFCKTPLYLDILVHRTSTKYFRNDADSKEVMLYRKLPVWMQEVVSTLEWRYLQKTSEEDKVTQEKILMLRPVLGKIAVNMKFSEQTIVTLNEWTNWLDLDMIKTALSIGYLRLQNQLLDKTLCTVIEFQDSYFTDHFAGLYFHSASKAVEHLENMIIKDTEEETNQLIIFICGYQQSLKEAVLECVLKYDKIYILVDILHLGIDPEDNNIKKILKSKPFTMKISSHDIEKRETELNKFGPFCQKNNIIARTISLHCGGGGQHSLLESLKLPPAQQLEFVEQNFEEEKYFSDCLKWLYEQTVVKKCRFHKCRLPETFSEEVQSDIKHLTNQGISVERETDDVIEVIERATFWKVVQRKIRQLGNVFQTD